MHSSPTSPGSTPPGADPAGTLNVPWFRMLGRYEWFVFIVAALGWLFDTMDQQLFNLARVPAMNELLATSAGEPPSDQDVAFHAGLATAIFMVGWATGGLIFGIMGDRLGRAKTMLLTILMYSICTGLSALSVGFWDFAFYRLLTGMGVGGEFAVGVALVAEVMPDRARPYALGMLQALSAVGNVSAALITLGIGQLQQSEAIDSGWRWMFVIGTVPALLAVVVRRRLKEPDRWQAAATGVTAERLGSIAELFSTPTLRRNAIVGLLLATAGVIGVWGIGFFSFDLFRGIFRARFEAEGLSPSEVEGQLMWWTGWVSILQNVGAFLGIYAFSMVTSYIGRKKTFALGFICAAASTALVFALLNSFWHVFVMIPIMGFFQLSVFGGYAIYFPELFPTRLRSTGVSFCYNVGRYVAAPGPFLFGLLTSRVFADMAEPMRYAGVTMCAAFGIGLVALFFAPETLGKPLPE